MAELYAGDPESFTGRRGELVTAARDAGDRVAAKAIGALRRPTRVAWVVNTLARGEPGAATRLASLAEALREAQRAKDGRRLRELSAERGEVIDSLTARALFLASVADAPPALRLEVSQTLTAALADPGTAADFAAGTLTRAVQWSGFGVLPAGGDENADATDRAASSGTEKPTATAPQAKPAAVTRATLKAAGRKPPRARAGQAGRQADQADQAAHRAKEARQRAEQAAAERAAQQRERYAEAERAVAAAAAAAAEAGAAEDRLENEVRKLEQRLTEARSELTTARLRARRTESTERRARSDLGRLSPPGGHSA
jgi:hypothetical protein